MQDRESFDALGEPRSFSLAVSYKHNSKFSKNELRRKISTFWFIEKDISNNFDTFFITNLLLRYFICERRFKVNFYNFLNAGPSKL